MDWLNDGLLQENLNSAVHFSFLPLRKGNSLKCEYSEKQWGPPKSNNKWRFCNDNFRLHCLQIHLQIVKVNPLFMWTLPCACTDLCKSVFRDIWLKTQSCKVESYGRGWVIVKVW